MIFNRQYNFIFLKQRRTSSTSLEVALSRLCSADDIITKVNRASVGAFSQWQGRPPQNYLDEQQPYFYGINFRQNLRYCLYHNLKQLFKVVPLSRTLFRFSDPPNWRSLQLKTPNHKYYGHMPVSQVRQHLGDAVFHNAFKFTVVRNPYDQILSWYFWIQKTGGKEFRSSFDVFVQRKGREFFESNKVVFVENDQSLVDEMLRYESLQSDLSDLSRRLRLPENVGDIYSKINTNRSARGGRGYHLIDPKSQEAILESADFFFEKCGYSKDIPK